MENNQQPNRLSRSQTNRQPKGRNLAPIVIPALIIAVAGFYVGSAQTRLTQPFLTDCGSAFHSNYHHSNSGSVYDAVYNNMNYTNCEHELGWRRVLGYSMAVLGVGVFIGCIVYTFLQNKKIKAARKS
jgi:hypothetical protein